MGRIMENKRKTVEEFVVKGERLMEDPKSPKFLETHVSKLKEAWDDAQKKAQERKKALEDNLDSWKIFDTKKVDCSKILDSADKHFKSIKRIYDLERGPADLADKLKTAAAMRAEIEDFFGQVHEANEILQVYLPLEMKEPKNAEVKVLRERLVVLNETDQALAEIFKFNQELAEFDKTLTACQAWVDGKAKEKLDAIRKPQDSLLAPDPEEKCGKVLELAEDLLKKSAVCKSLEEKKVDMFPKEGQKVSSHAKEFLERLKKLRDDLTAVDDDINKEFDKYSGDVRYFAEYQTALQEFYPSLVDAEDKVSTGLGTPDSLVTAENTLDDAKTFQSHLAELVKVLDVAAGIAQKMSHHDHADITVASFRQRWDNTQKICKKWVEAVNELVGCWSQLEGKIDELTKWVDASKSSDPGAQAGLSIDKLEEQLNLLKVNFKEKQSLVEAMSSTCKGKSYNRRKSQVMMNVRRMTMLPVEEMRKLSQIAGVDDAPYPEAPETEPKEAEDVTVEEAGLEEASAEATVTVAPTESVPAEEEKKD